MAQKHLADELGWLALPNRDIAPFTSSSLQYGAGKIAADYCGVPDIPEQIYGGWHHGWYAKHRIVGPEYLLEPSIANPKVEPTWVAQVEHQEYIRQHGFAAKAIGLPFAYLPERSYERRKGSLLVMPAHSLAYTKHTWKFDEYARAIDAIRDRFSDVVVCLHAGCIKNGYWVHEFRDLGFPVIEGADANDRNSLERIRALMSQFEFVTTNTQGSCIAYACAYGAKTSLYGPYAELEIDDFSGVEFYLRRPGLARKLVNASTEQTLREQIGEFFTDPDAAPTRQAWGEEQLGVQNIVSPSELKQLFRWDSIQNRQHQAGSTPVASTKQKLVRRIKSRIKRVLDPDAWAVEQEIDRLNRYPANEAGVATIQGKSFRFANAADFITDYEQVYWRRAFELACLEENPRIVDCAAGIGIAVRYWTDLYPRANIVAIESNSSRHEVLATSAAEICKQKPSVSIKCLHGHLSGDVSNRVAADGSLPHRIDLKSLLEAKTDFLNLRINEEDLDLFLDCQTHIRDVHSLRIEIASSGASRLDDLLSYLKQHGFHCRIQVGGDPRLSPLQMVVNPTTQSQIVLVAIRNA